MTTLINVDAGVTANKLKDFIADKIETQETRTSFLSDCANFIKNKQTEALISKYLEHSKEIFTAENEREAEGCIQAIDSVMETFGGTVDSVSVVRQIIQAITSDEEHPKLRLKGLVTLFNLTSLNQSKFDILTAIFRYAMSTDLSSLVYNFHSNVESWALSWELSLQERRTLFRLVSDLLTAHGKSSLSLRHLIRYFSTFSGEAFPADVEAIALAAVIDAVKSPLAAFSDRSLLFESLKDRGSGELRILISLLQIVCDGSLENLLDFERHHSDLMIARGLIPVEIRRSVSLLTLCSLAARDSVISFAKIAEAVRVPIDEVELWVVDAMAEGLIEGSIDQATSLVTISRFAHRSFGLSQWQHLQSKLRGIRATLDIVLSTHQAAAAGGGV